MEYVKLKSSNILEIGVLDKNNNPTGEVLTFDIEDIETAEKYNECAERHHENVKKFKFDIAVIEKKQDVTKKGSLMSENEKAKMQRIRQFYKDEMEALDLFLGENGTLKMLAGRKPYVSMYEDITEALEKDVLPHLKTNYESLVDKIKSKYKVETAENIIDMDNNDN